MKLLFFSTMKGSPWGGSEELWAAATLEAVHAGHEVRASVFEWPQMHARPRALADAGIKLILRPQKRSRILDHLRTPEWQREIEAFSPDVVCLSQGGAYEAAGRKSVHPFVRWLLARNIPFVNVVQYNDDDDDLRADTRSLAAALKARAHANAFVARRNIAQAARALRGPVPRAMVVRNPVNLMDTSALDWPIDVPPAEFAVVARLQAATKGQDLLLEALAAPIWQSRDWRLTLFGEGPDADAFASQAARLGLGERVVLAGQTTNIRAVWATRHLLILPSRAEGTPLAMVEAMLLARPCLVTDVGGCPDWVREGVEGWVAPRAAAPDIGAALQRAWDARAAWREVGLAARARALALHDPAPGRTLLSLLSDATTAALT